MKSGLGECEGKGAFSGLGRLGEEEVLVEGREGGDMDEVCVELRRHWKSCWEDGDDGGDDEWRSWLRVGRSKVVDVNNHQMEKSQASQ